MYANGREKKKAEDLSLYLSIIVCPYINILERKVIRGGNEKSEKIKVVVVLYT